jgi:ADP-dependent phosphofructokinase/glucokinase
MSDSLQYMKGEKISLKNHFNEKWLQDRIEEDPSILNLGDLDIIQRESYSLKMSLKFHEPKSRE